MEAVRSRATASRPSSSLAEKGMQPFVGLGSLNAHHRGWGAVGDQGKVPSEQEHPVPPATLQLLLRRRVGLR